MQKAENIHIPENQTEEEGLIVVHGARVHNLQNVNVEIPGINLPLSPA